MPIYEYECAGCGHGLEALQKISEPPLRVCPSCKEDSLQKKIAAVSFRLSGSGWYETDFKQGDKKNLTQKEGAEQAQSKEATTKEASANSDDSNTSNKKDGKDSNKETKETASKSNTTKDTKNVEKASTNSNLPATSVPKQTTSKDSNAPLNS